MQIQLGLAPAPGVVEAVSAIYEAFGRQDVPTILGLMADDVRWEDGMLDHGVPWLQPGSGRDAVAGFFQAMGELLQIDDLQLRSMMATGNQVGVLVDITAHDRLSGQDLSDPGELHLWTVEDGRVIAFRHYVDTHRHVLATR